MADDRSNPDSRDDPLLTTTQAGRLLGVDRHTVARYVRLGQLRARRLPSGHIRIRRSELDRFRAEGEG